MKIDTIAMGRPLAQVPGLVREVEDCGFDGLWFTESGRTAYTGCTAAALTAERLDIGTAVALAFPRSPMVTAQIAWELAETTGGRFVLGLGTQVKAHIERRYSATFDHPGSRLREYVLALRAIFRAFQGEELLDFHGDFWSFDLLPRMWSPGPIEVGAPPIYVAAVRPWSARMAGEVADGIHVHPFHSMRYLEEVTLPAIREGAAAAGRSADDVAIVCPVMAIIGDTEEERAAARDQTRLRIAFYGSTRTYRGVFDLHGWEGTSERLHELQRAGDLPAMAATITDEMLDVYSLETTWDGLADALLAKYGDIADRVIMYDATGGWSYGDGTLDRWRAVTSAITPAAGTPAAG
ncbi:MAG: TIGR03617 family F420-dependent LLM class oxidoreductase [Acidimicrobiia bacterium]|nr:TIGR03617 family F420-dependent LLM class oxidoreductase [Acidimicrobiia bacterium]